MSDPKAAPRVVVAPPDSAIARRLRREGVAFQSESVFRPNALPERAVVHGDLSALEVARLGARAIRVLWGDDGRAATGLVLPQEVLDGAQRIVVALQDEASAKRAEEMLRKPGREVRRDPSAARRFVEDGPEEGVLLVARLSVPEADRLGIPYAHCEPLVPGDPEAGLAIELIMVSLSVRAAGALLRDAAAAASIDPEADRKLLEARRGLTAAVAATVMGDALDAHLRGAFTRLDGKTG